MKNTRNMRTIIYTLLGIALLCISWITPSASAQTAQVANGITWLKTNQHGDGSWGSLNSFRDTSTVADTYRLLGQTDSSYQNALTWMSGFTLESNDFLARRIAILKASGADVSADVQRLVSAQNFDGGWGYYPGYDSDIHDTMVVMEVLQAVSPQSTTMLARGASYFLPRQNQEGSWSVVPDSPGEVTTTSRIVVIQAISGSTAASTAAIDRAIAWLKPKQNLTDGGFGNSPSTVHDTVNALTAFLASGQIDGSKFQSALTYLATSQGANGSWGDSAFETATALQFLGNRKPDLSIFSSDIVPSNAQPKAGETVTIRATVTNIGSADAVDVPVKFMLEMPSGELIQIGSPKIIPSLPLGSSAFVEAELFTKDL